MIVEGRLIITGALAWESWFVSGQCFRPTLSSVLLREHVAEKRYFLLGECILGSWRRTLGVVTLDFIEVWSVRVSRLEVKCSIIAREAPTTTPVRIPYRQGLPKCSLWSSQLPVQAVTTPPFGRITCSTSVLFRDDII